MRLRDQLRERTHLSWETSAQEWEPTATRRARKHIELLIAEAGQRPPPTPQLEQLRTEVLVAWATTRTLEGLSARALRRVPFFVFKPSPSSGPPLAADSTFRAEYMRWLVDNGRGPTVAVLIKSFLDDYPTSQPWFEEWRHAMVSGLAFSKGPASERWLKRSVAFGLFHPQGVRQFLDAFKSSPASAEAILSEAGLDGELSKSRFLLLGQAQALKLLSQSIAVGDLKGVETWLGFLVENEKRLRFDSLRAQFASALLSPFRISEPGLPQLKARIQNLLLSLLGDPRITVAPWHGVADADRTTMVRWLTAVSFESFFQILNRTADEDWKARREFWSRYLPSPGRAGALTDLWPILGPMAKEVGEQQLKLDRQLFGAFPGRSGKSQSILIMRLRGPSGSVTVCEWSHAGAIRMWSGADKTPPSLYRATYTTKELMVPPDYWVPHDKPGNWKRKVLNWVLKETGAYPS